MYPIRSMALILAAFGLLCCCPALFAQGQGGKATHVVVIGFDGLSPRGVAESNTPTWDKIRARGAYSDAVRSVLPSSSSPNWASMIMGVGPEQHGVTSNDWKPNSFVLGPTVPGPAGFSETMFSVLRRERPDSRIAVFFDWKDFGRLVEPKVPDHAAHHPGPEPTMRAAVEYYRQHKPHLLFIQLDHIDGAGHKHGWNSEGYDRAVELGDRLAGNLLNAIEEAGLLDSTAIILTSDHGGIGKKHGGETMDEMLTPWAIAGPGIIAGKRISQPINIYDTACTVLAVMGVPVPDHWICRPVLAAFER